MADTTTPRCPNHRVPLEDCHAVKGVGTGICPISGCQFDYTAEYFEGEQVTKKDKFGNNQLEFKVTQRDGTGG